MEINQTLAAYQIIDIILLIIILVCAVKAFIDGFFTAVLRLAGNIISLIAAWIVSKKYSTVIFDSLFREKATDTTFNYIQNSVNALDVQQLLDNFVSGLPESFMAEFSEKAEHIINQLTSPTAETAQSIVDAVIAPVLTAVIAVVVFVVIFGVCSFVAGLLAKLLRSLNDVPVIGFANRLGGFAVGTVTGVINVVLISCLLSIIAIVTQNSLAFLNMEILAQSKVLSLTAIINPFIG